MSVVLGICAVASSAAAVVAARVVYRLRGSTSPTDRHLRLRMAGLLLLCLIPPLLVLSARPMPGTPAWVLAAGLSVAGTMFLVRGMAGET